MVFHDLSSITGTTNKISEIPVIYLSDLLLDAVPSHESVDHDLVKLSYPMCPGQGLDVIVRIPV